MNNNTTEEQSGLDYSHQEPVQQWVVDQKTLNGEKL